ncbi:MAG: hypothetical protein D6767_07850 [Candidatus Hydrogenedentota bacterium]|nr:MAG: hypothetical protein D6767_07850 [Candidatus Hydrogenedentota bacterium]
MKKISFFNHEYTSETKRSFIVSAGRTVTGSALEIPVWVIFGKTPSFSAFFTSTVHGDEIAGIRILENVFQATNPSTVHGVYVFLPILNPWGLQNQTRYMPDRRDLNRSFPGSATGSMSARLAHFYFENVIKKCQFGLDLHTGANHIENAPQIRGNMEQDTIRQLAEDIPDIIRIHSKASAGTLRKAAANRKIPVLLYEGGEAFRFEKANIEAGTQVCLRLIELWQKFSSLTTNKQRRKASIYQSHGWLRASHPGIFIPKVSPGQSVQKGQLLGYLESFTTENPKMLFAKQDGMIIGIRQLPVVYEGDPLLHFAIPFLDSDSRRYAENR